MKDTYFYNFYVRLNDIYKLLNPDDFELVEPGFKMLNSDQQDYLKSRYGSNIDVNGIMVSVIYEHLLFTSMETWKNWLYYAGFEYIDIDNIVKVESPKMSFVIIPDDDDEVDLILTDLSRLD